jgi:hypothetical protein
MNVLEQIQRGYLVCPRSHTPLTLEARELVAGQQRYALNQGVPVFIDTQIQAEYLAENDGSMVAEYATVPGGAAAAREGSAAVAGEPLPEAGAVQAWPPQPQPQGGVLPGWKQQLKQRLLPSDDYRSERSKQAFQTAIAQQPDGALLLSVGGGPLRPDPKLTNLNIDAFVGVDVVADAYALPYADQVVDGIFCEAVLEHLEFPDRAVAEMARVLKPGGQIFCATPFLQPYHGYPNHFQNFTLTGHERLFLRHGLELLDSGVCVGPSFVLSQLGQAYFAVFGPGLLSGRLLRLAMAWLRRRDRQLNRQPVAADYASTTFVHCRKP